MNNNGEKILQRAHVLASINYLAANVPSSVIQHLGNEIQERIDDTVETQSLTVNNSPSMKSAQPFPRANNHESAIGQCLSSTGKYHLPFISDFECALLFGKLP